MPREKVRLDRLLVSSGLVETRQRAQAMILAGKVEVDGRRADKPGVCVDPGLSVKLIEQDHPYVSRGGLKLEGALRALGVAPEGRVCLDAGASTGGFTHCLLLHGAARVYAVDVGYGQFDWLLRNDPRVVLRERTNVRYLSRDHVPEPMDLVVADLSFISLTKVVPHLIPFLAPRGEMLCLVKPQFEAGRERVGKGGVVRDPDCLRDILEEMGAFFLGTGLELLGTRESVLKGPKGNREFFFHARKSVSAAEEDEKGSSGAGGPHRR
jgi:23S rRNA (cytidine1920-2'-O)/16S rRNA (cytidine1409-2'-O)-methyltransferase